MLSANALNLVPSKKCFIRWRFRLINRLQSSILAELSLKKSIIFAELSFEPVCQNQDLITIKLTHYQMTKFYTGLN